MFALGRNVRWVCVLLLASLSAGAVPGRMLADEKSKSDGEQPVNSAPANPSGANVTSTNSAAANSGSKNSAAANSNAAKGAEANSSSETPASSNATNSNSAKPAVVKMDAPAGLTERERMLLDRVEELEKRVADLEASREPAAAATNAEVAAAAPPNLQPGPGNAKRCARIRECGQRRCGSSNARGQNCLSQLEFLRRHRRPRETRFPMIR